MCNSLSKMSYIEQKQNFIVCYHIWKHLSYFGNVNHISLVIKQSLFFFSFQNYPKNLDLSYKTDLDCLRKVKLVLLQNFTGFVICSH